MLLFKPAMEAVVFGLVICTLRIARLLLRFTVILMLLLLLNRAAKECLRSSTEEALFHSVAKTIHAMRIFVVKFDGTFVSMDREEIWLRSSVLREILII